MESTTDPTDRIARQLRFVVEIDRLKRVLRQTLITDASRRENSAEHSWHLAIMAALMYEHAAEPVDVLHTVKMVLVHDIVEIDAGDTFGYDTAGHLDKEEREKRAADRIFALLPEDQAGELRALWDEFEAGATPEARFALAMDRIQPLLNNFHTQGGTWKQHGITREQVLKRMDPIRTGAPPLWPYVLRIVDESCAAGYIPEPPVQEEEPIVAGEG
ncbi:MAG: HD domain-containing protein [Gemmatimonadetes bacterium]|nr:HD domain-containing protein [Gemmatimonadota bacterium]